MESMMEFFRGLRDRLYALGAEGQEGADLRQVNVVTAVSAIVLFTMPGYAIFFAAYDFDRMALATHLALLATFPFILPLILLAARRQKLARIVLGLLLNGIILVFTYLYSAPSGTPIFCFSTVLIAFLIFDRAQGWLLGGFVTLPVLIYVYVMFHFRAPYPALNLDQTVLDILFIINSITAFFIIALITHIFYALVARAEDGLQNAHAREAQFAGAVSEYLDPSLVDNLRGGADLRPRLRHLTVFFTDLVGSTRLSFAMGQDEYGRMINAYVREMQAIIKGAGAYIEDISGEAMSLSLLKFVGQASLVDDAMLPS